MLIYTQGNEARYGVRKYNAIVKSLGRKWFTVSTGDRCYFERDHKFSLENGENDGKGYISNYRVYLSEEDYNQDTGIVPLRFEVSELLKKLSYKELLEIKSKYEK